MKYLYRLYLVIIVLPILVVVTILASVTTAAGSVLGGGRIFSYYPGWIWSRVTLYLLLCPVSVSGKEYIKPGTSYVVTPNHTSAIDIYLLYGYFDRPFKWVMKGALRKIPVVGWACEKAGFIFVNLAKPMEVVYYAESAIKDRYSIIIFPEGTRSEDGRVGRLKKGAFRIAGDTGAPILPVYIHGAYDVLPKHGFWPRPGRLELKFFPELRPDDFRDEDGKVDVSSMLRVVDGILRAEETIGGKQS